MKQVPDLERCAIWYVQHFHAVVPVGAWEFTRANGEKVNAWKSPLISNWTEHPLATVKEVKELWQKYAEYGNVPNIGIATGQICGGYIVIDLDKKPEHGVDGYEELKEWQRKNGVTLPETWTAISGGGGYHLWYHTDIPMRGYANEDYGIDLRADGSQIIVPPSIHQSGRRYEWEISPGDMGCAEADEVVLKFIQDYQPSGNEYRQHSFRGREDSGNRVLRLPENIKEGGRTKALVSLIGSLNRIGVSDEGIKRLVEHENLVKNNPPLTERELNQQVYPAIYRYEKGIRAEEWKRKEDYIAQMKARSMASVAKQRATRS